VLLPFSEKVSASKVNLNGAEGWYERVAGAENVPNVGSCVDGWLLTLGAGFVEITNVALRVLDPEESVAVKLIGIPVTASVPTSLLEGVPDIVRVLLSRESQLGPLDIA
jgi:hypothetical protein